MPHTSDQLHTIACMAREPAAPGIGEHSNRDVGNFPVWFGSFLEANCVPRNAPPLEQST